MRSPPHRVALVTIALLAACAGAAKPPPAPVVAEPPAAASSTPSASAPIAEIDCVRPMLMSRKEMSPRSKEFDLGATSFDAATKQYEQKAYADAAKGFLAASEHFAQAGDEDDWKWSVQNAGYAYEQAGHADEGRKAMEALASRDPSHAITLRAIAADLSDDARCK
jgi:hypothetical protein